LKKNQPVIAALKDNRLLALSREDQKHGRFVPVSERVLTDQQALRGGLKGFEQDVRSGRRVFTHTDGGAGLLNPVCRDWARDGEHVVTLYPKRWNGEDFHHSLKARAGLAKSHPAR
jgi:hypothetical protein